MRRSQTRGGGEKGSRTEGEKRKRGEDTVGREPKRSRAGNHAGDGNVRLSRKGRKKGGRKRGKGKGPLSKKG